MEATFDTYEQDKQRQELATKGDCLAFAVELRLDIKKVRQEIVESKAEIIKWMFTIAAGQAALIIAILKLFPSH